MLTRMAKESGVERISSATFGLPPRARDFHRQNKRNPARCQGIHNARRNPIEAGKNQTIEIAEGEPLRRFSSQHIELVAQRQNLRLGETFDLNRPTTAHQISLRISPMGASIARFAATRRARYLTMLATSTAGAV
jgi:hypothetical protein